MNKIVPATKHEFDSMAKKHTTHYACEKMYKKYGGKVGCCRCTNHKCEIEKVMEGKMNTLKALKREAKKKLWNTAELEDTQEIVDELLTKAFEAGKKAKGEEVLVFMEALIEAEKEGVLSVNSKTLQAHINVLRDLKQQKKGSE